jgi:co-chaperonin GroES (HSP10)
MSINKSGILPTEFNVLVLPDPVEEVTKGGIILTDPTKESDKHAAVEGTLVAISPLAFTYEDWEDVHKPKVGQKVIYARYAGNLFDGNDGKEYRLLKDKDLLAVKVA